MTKNLKEQVMDQITVEVLRGLDYNEIVNEKRVVPLLREVMEESGVSYYTIDDVKRSYYRVLNEAWKSFGKGKHGIR